MSGTANQNWVGHLPRGPFDGQSSHEHYTERLGLLRGIFNKDGTISKLGVKTLRKWLKDQERSAK